MRSTWSVVPELVLAGWAADPRRAATVGRPVFGGGDKGQLTGEVLRNHLDRVRAIFGPDFVVLEEADQRLRRKGVPVRDRHRLMVNFDRVSVSAEWLDHRLNQGDVLCTTELLATVELFERWQGHPAWKCVARGLKNRTDYPHALLLLAFTSWLVDNGHAVVLVDDPKTRMADLRLSVIHGDVAVELKTPQALQDREAVLDAREADELVRKGA